MLMVVCESSFEKVVWEGCMGMVIREGC
jgi:hypothetical protein